jgi:DNA ligase (NAD+)
VLAQQFKTMDNLMKARKEDFDAIYEVGQVMADSIVKFFKQEGTQRLIKKLKSAGLNLEEKVAPARKSHLTDKTVVFTGELKNLSRHQAEGLVRQFGGTASSSVSKNTDLVVAGENPGSKYDKARRLGVKIIDEQQFEELIK